MFRRQRCHRNQGRRQKRLNKCRTPQAKLSATRLPRPDPDLAGRALQRFAGNPIKLLQCAKNGPAIAPNGPLAVDAANPVAPDQRRDVKRYLSGDNPVLHLSLLVCEFNKAAEKLGRKVDDDASALGFDRAQPATFDGAVYLTRHKLVTNIRATKAEILAASERHEQLLEAHEKVWKEINEGGINTSKRLQIQLPLPLARNISHLATDLHKGIVQTGLLEITNEPDGQDGDDILTKLLHGCIVSETLAGISANNKRHATSEVSQQTQVIPATQYQPALVEALTELTIEASKQKNEIKTLRNQQATTSQEQAQRIELLEEQKNDWERKASEPEANVNTFKIELEEKQREIDGLNGIILTTVESDNTIVRNFSDPTGEDDISEDECERAMNSTQSYVEHHQRNDLMMRARFCLQDSDINSNNADIERLQDELDAEQKDSAFYFALVETKSTEIIRLNDEKNGVIATLQSEIETLRNEHQKTKYAQKNLGNEAEASKRSYKNKINEAKSENRGLKAEYDSLQSRISTLSAKQLTANETAQELQDLKRSKAFIKTSLQREKNGRIRTLAEANRSKEQMLSSLTAFVFDKDDDLVSGFKTVMTKDNQPARQAYQPWSIKRTWNKAGPYYDCNARGTGELFVRLVSIVRTGALATDEFLVTMKKFTSIMATTSEANIAVIVWLLEVCNSILSSAQAMADIPAKTAVWVLADILASRWSNMERHVYDIPMFAEVRQSVHAPEEDPCWNWILTIQHDEGRQRFLAKQVDWIVGVLIDPTNRRCTFLEREMVAEVDEAQIGSDERIRICGPGEQSFSFGLRSAETIQSVVAQLASLEWNQNKSLARTP